MNYENPIIRGFNPDPSICRVGEDYYLATSTFEYFPAISIYHSRDLINWRQVGSGIDRVGQLDMNAAHPSGGVWAPTIRYYEGTFYLTATFSEKGNFIVTARRPEGPWSDPVWVEMDGLDPSVYFEDGKMYYCANDCGERYKKYGCEGVSAAVVNPATGRLESEITRIWSGTGGGFLEAPHIYRIGEWYYIFTAEGGTNYNHFQTVGRSRTLLGPYEPFEGRPLLTNRHDTTKKIQCTGHADLVEDKDGGWWMVHLGTRRALFDYGSLGRETFLTPVEWKDGWPYVMTDGKAVSENPAPAGVTQIRGKRFEADFTKPRWECDWLRIKNPAEENYSRRDGVLTLKPSMARVTEDGASPSFAAVRQGDFESHIRTEVAFEPMEEGDEAGVIVYLCPDISYRMAKRRGRDGDFLVVEKKAFDFEQTAYSGRCPAGRLTMEIRSTKEGYVFFCNGERLAAASGKFISTDLAGKCFTGTLLGIYAQCRRDTEARARFYSFLAEAQ